MSRNKGDSNVFRQQRTDEIWDAYVKIMGIYGGKVSTMTIYSMVAYSPASRFFVTADWAYRIVKNYEKEKEHRSNRSRMYQEIYARVQEMMESNPEMSLMNAVTLVVKQPAPEMYLDPVDVMKVIKKESKRRGEEKRRAFIERQKRISMMKE